METEEDWLELFSYIEEEFNAAGLSELIADDEDSLSSKVIETMRLLYIDLRNTDRSTAKLALEFLADNLENELEKDYFTIVNSDPFRKEDVDRLVNIDDIPDNSLLQEEIRSFVIALGGPDFGNDPDGGFSPRGGGGGPRPFGDFSLEPRTTKDESSSEPEQAQNPKADQDDNHVQQTNKFGW